MSLKKASLKLELSDLLKRKVEFFLKHLLCNLIEYIVSLVFM